MEEDNDWDENERRANLEKLGIDFTAVYDFDRAAASVEQDLRHHELRFVACGYIGVRPHGLIYAERGIRTRFISWRNADPPALRHYEKE